MFRSIGASGGKSRAKITMPLNKKMKKSNENLRSALHNIYR